MFEVLNGNKSAQWPISLPTITVGGTNIQAGVPVQLQGHWLRQLRLTVRNISTKTIVNAHCDLWFPETGRGTTTSPIFSVPLNLGRPPDAAFYRKDGTRIDIPPSISKTEPISIPPGGEMTFAVQEAEPQDDQAVASQESGGSVGKVTIYVSMVYFSDDSRWMSQTYYAPPVSPGHWVGVSPGEFLPRKQ
jgi:hypothetical protein